MACYTQNYLCFIDILGFKDAILNPKEKNKIYNGSPDYFLEGLNSLRKILNKPDFFLPKIEISQFSDCVALSFPCVSNEVNFLNLSIVFDRIIELQQYLLEGAFLTRGAITKGNLYHQENVIFGPALIEAVELEKDKAIFPRVILSNSIYKEIIELKTDWCNILFSKIGDSQDNYYYVDYLSTWHIFSNEKEFINDKFTFIKQIVENGLNNSINSNIKDKYIWLADKFNKIICDKPNNYI